MRGEERGGREGGGREGREGKGREGKGREGKGNTVLTIEIPPNSGSTNFRE